MANIGDLDYAEDVRVLFLSRKYPPQKGGMESYSYNLITNYIGTYTAKTLGRRQINLLWFFPYCLIYTLLHLKDYDVIQLGDMLLCSIGWLSKKIKPSVRVVATVHGLDITYKNALYQFYLRRFSYGFDMYVPNSTYTKEIAESRNYYPCTVIEPATLKNEVNKEPAYDRKTFCDRYGIPKDAYVILTVGRLVERKGVNWFIRNVMSQLRGENFRYLVVGTGEMEATIRETIHELGETRVKLLGYVGDMELNNLYCHSDIFLMPNILVQNDVEGFGMVAVEAAARDCLVVAADLQGIRDAVRNNVSGILYKAGAASELTTLLSHIMGHYDSYKYICHTGAEYVLGKYTGKAIAKRYGELMAQVVDGRKEAKSNLFGDIIVKMQNENRHGR